MTQQIDCEFKTRYFLGGAHIHVTLFIRKRGQQTWQNTGSIVIGEDQILALSEAWSNIKKWEQE